MAEQMPWEMYGGGQDAPQPQSSPMPWEMYASRPNNGQAHGATATAIKGFAQGITGNFADEIDAAMTAAHLNPFSDAQGTDFWDSYAKKQAWNRAVDAQDIQAHPVANVVGNVGGALALTPVLPGLTAEALPGQMLQGGLQGAGLGAVYGFGGGEGGIGNRVGNAAENAAIGGVAGAAIPAVIRGISGITGGGTPPPPTSSEIKGLANAAYTKADELGGMLSPKVTNEFVAEASKNLSPQTEAGKLVTGSSVVTDLTERLRGLVDKPLSLQAAQEIDEGLGNLISNEYSITGLSKDGKKLLDLQSNFRNAVENASPENGGVLGNADGFNALKEGRQLWAQAARLRDIENILAKAEISEQPANAIRSGFKSLASNPTRMRGYDKETAALIRRAAKTGIVGEGLRLAGSRLTAIAASGAGLAGGGPVGAALAGGGTYLTGMAARKAGEALAKGRATDVLRSIAGGAEQAVEANPEVIQPAINAVQGLTNAARAPQGQSQPAPMPVMPLPTYPTYNNVPPQAAAPLASQVIASEEGRKPYSYKDTGGNRTVGIGFNMDQPNAAAIWKRAGVGENFNAVYNGTQPLSRASIDQLNAFTTQVAQKAAQRLVPGFDKLGENQKAALTSLALQLGGKEFSKFKALQYLKEGNAKAVENSLLNTKLAEQTPARARRMALMLAYDIPHEQADRLLAQQGRIKPNERKYI